MPGFRKKHKSRAKWLSQKNAIYIAGLFDGEGWVHLKKRGRSIGANVGIASTYKPIINYLVETTGLGANWKQILIDKRHKKPCYYWYVAALQEVVDFLSQIYPYLKIKREIVGEAVGYLLHYYGRRLKKYRWAKEKIKEVEDFKNSKKRRE